MQHLWDWNWIQAKVKDILTWNWTKHLLYWLIISAGTMSECVFLLASLWMSINSSVHPLVMLVMSDAAAGHVSEVATAAYVALPECILGLAFVTVISHVRTWRYTQSLSSLVWAVLYGLPTLVFLVLSLVTLGCSVASTHFIMPEPFVIIRALAGYMFAFTSLLHAQLGIPQERDRLQQKDGMLDALREQHTANLDEHTREMERIKTLLAEYKNTERELINTVHKSSDTALQAYSEECVNWLKNGVKTVMPDEITRYTGHSKRRIDTAITKGLLQTSSRNKELILVSSLVKWLEITPPSTGKVDDGPILHIVKEA